MTRVRRFALRLGLTLCFIIYIVSATHLEPARVLSVSVDLAKPQKVVWPCEVSIVGDMGEKGLRIPPKVGRGWAGEAGGEASYKFYIPQTGKYYVWLYCLWYDVCTNAVFAKIDDMDRAILGNDPIMKEWHWVRSFAVTLGEGTHTLVLSNHSDHIALQKVAFTNSAFSAPDNCPLVFAEMFYEDFDGCDRGNFSNWKILAGKWKVHHPAGNAKRSDNVLTGQSQGQSLIVIPEHDWADYALNVRIKCAPPGDQQDAMDLYFGYQGPENHYLFRMQPIAGGECDLSLWRQSADQKALLCSGRVAFDPNQWHPVEVSHGNGELFVSLDGQERLRGKLAGTLAGSIGFGLSPGLMGSFDSIHIRHVQTERRKGDGPRTPRTP